MTVRVVSGSESEAAERATIEQGTPSAELMRRAGSRAATVIHSRFDSLLRDGVKVVTGAGNNGGDGWITAHELHRGGVGVSVTEIAAPKSEESIAARASALKGGVTIAVGTSGNERVVVDALLGTGASGAPRGRMAEAIADIAQRRESGARVVSLDLPSGLDSTTAAGDGSVIADLTISFGTMKRGHLLSRQKCGEIVVLDIGLSSDTPSGLPVLIDRDWVDARVPSITPDAHKGTRRRLSIVGGGPGMAGATILAGRGALRSGIGLLRIVAASTNAMAIHAAVPAAVFQQLPATAGELAKLIEASDVVAIGPGLGNTPMTRDLVDSILLAWSGPVVLDADALNIFAGDLVSLASLLGKRPAIITPHPAEMARLIGSTTDDVLRDRFDVGTAVAAELGAAVLLKGTPTIVFSPNGERHVVAAGTAALATGGSGDVLTGITATLLGQMPDGADRAATAAACAAFVHGRAAELCKFVRGTTVDDVIGALPTAWNERPATFQPPIMADLAGQR